MALNSQGYEVFTGKNGVEALKLARINKPDLIISDIMMPQMDGFEFCRKLKGNNELKDIPFVFYTATYTEHQDEELALSLGASRFIIKPVEAQQLMIIIHEILEASQAGELLIHDKPLKEKNELNDMYLHSVGRKLDKKVRELEQERESLKKSESRYRHLVESTQNYYFFYRHNTEGIFSYLSPSIENILGYKVDEFLTHYTEYLTDNPINDKVEYFTKLCIKGHEQPPYELEIMAKNGSFHWLEVKEVPVMDQYGNVYEIDGIAHDITERKQSAEKLQHALVQTIQAMANTLEQRDPYTAGHQRRVADLAVAIATEMRMNDESLQSIRMGAIIHDIGKIHIPAEILNRPGKLSKAEFAIIKQHAEVGYNIIKDIDFPWPIAKMIQQHHERLNGSGYPKGLEGDAICLEARILMVSDVVEAMASHRPYRPGLGIEMALNEIRKNCGIIYDADVVNSCLKLFEDKGYLLNNET